MLQNHCTWSHPCPKQTGKNDKNLWFSLQSPTIWWRQNLSVSWLETNHNDVFCSSQPSMVHCPSSSIFPWLLSSSSHYGNTRPNLHSFQYIQALYILTQYHLIPSSTKLYWPSTTNYQPVPPNTDPASTKTNQYCLLLTPLRLPQ